MRYCIKFHLQIPSVAMCCSASANILKSVVTPCKGCHLPVLRLYGMSGVKINFRTKTVLLLANKMIAHVINAISATIKKLVKMKNAFRY